MSGMRILRREKSSMATLLRGHVFILLAVGLAAAGGCEDRPAAQQPAAAENRPAAERAAGAENPSDAPPAEKCAVEAAAGPPAAPAGYSSSAGTPASSAGAPAPVAAPTVAFARAAGREADNDRCHVCHVNFSEDALAVGHARNNVGCERCHGPSDEHCSDEGNITPPEIMFAREKIDRACKECHPDPMERLVLEARYCLFVALTDEEKKKVCTDCHGSHRMNVRTVRWDKATGKLIEEPDADK